MAIKKEVWLKARDYFELGKSLTYIADTLEIDRSTVSKKAKAEKWEKGKNQQLKSDIEEYEEEKSRLEGKKSRLVEKVAKLSDFSITTLSEAIEEDTKISSLITSTSTLAVIRNNQILTNNKKTVMMKVIQYNDKGFKYAEDYEPYEIPLNPSDIKDVVDSTDKASVTLKINQRHATTQINNTNAQQNNETKWTVELKEASSE